jgi:hypothetical protein
MPQPTEPSSVLELPIEELKLHTGKRELLKKLCLAATASVLFLLFLEGLCSSLSASYQLFSPQDRGTLSGAVMHYDQQLGWLTVPNFHQENYFAPGIGLTTNSVGLRASEEFTPQVPSGKTRIICSGDSFTFGEGVGDEHTWCRQLESLDQRFQTVNMGESGYGVDQMYLWYGRQGAVLDHNVHIFAFIIEDFRRMQLTNYIGYGKPLLRVRDGELVTENVPVPRQSRALPWLERKRVQLQEFRSVKLLGSLVAWAHPARDPFSDGPTDEQAQTVDKMLENLQAIEKQKDSTLLLVCLPSTVHQHEQSGPAPAWRAWIRGESAKRGIEFVDLIDDFHKLPVTMQDGMFIWPGAVHYFAEAPGHYNDEGNEWVAKELYRRLSAPPEVSGKHGPLSEKRFEAQNSSFSLQRPAEPSAQHTGAMGGTE